MEKRKQEISFEVVGGMCTLSFGPASSTGREADTNPGIAFRLESPSAAHYLRGKYHHGSGVIGRKAIMQLRTLLDEWIAANP